MSNFLVILTIIGLTFPCVARVFNLQAESFATYFGGTYSTTNLKQSYFSGTSGTVAGVSNSIDSTVTTFSGGELGMVFSAPRAGFRLGVEVFNPYSIKLVPGKNSSGANLFDFSSTTIGVIPKASFDIYMRVTPISRWTLTFGGGWGQLSYRNSYAFSAAGQTQYPGVADYTEAASGLGGLYETRVGYEHLFSDSTTFVFEAGYRRMIIPQFKYTSAVTSMDGKAHAASDIVLNSDDTKKASDLSGAMASIQFRFYLGN